MEKYNPATLTVFDYEKPWGIDEDSFEAFVLYISNLVLHDIRDSLTLTNIDIDMPFAEIDIFDIFNRGLIALAVIRKLEKESTQEFFLESSTLNSTIAISFDLVEGCLKLRSLGNDKLMQLLRERGDRNWGVFVLEWA